MDGGGAALRWTRCGRAFRPDAFVPDRGAIWNKSVGPEGPPTSSA
ncbi:DUF6053 domain-containing protein [Lysobacter enzymogenes]